MCHWACLGYCMDGWRLIAWLDRWGFDVANGDAFNTNIALLLLLLSTLSTKRAAEELTKWMAQRNLTTNQEEADLLRVSTSNGIGCTAVLSVQRGCVCSVSGEAPEDRSECVCVCVVHNGLPVKLEEDLRHNVTCFIFVFSFYSFLPPSIISRGKGGIGPGRIILFFNCLSLDFWSRNRLKKIIKEKWLYSLWRWRKYLLARDWRKQCRIWWGGEKVKTVNNVRE